MRINNNLMAMNTHRQLGITTTMGSKSMEKLSSGYRINRAGDDAAGLAISEKMRGQIRGLGQASRNAQDAISLIQTSEGALNETHAILQRMRELAVQSATDTNTTQDRSNIQDEINQLGKEIDRIANTTEFNTKKLLNGSLGGAQTVATGTIANTGNLGAAMADATVLNVLVDKDGNNLGLATGDVITATWSVNGSQQTATYTIADVAANTLGLVNAAIAANATVASAATVAGVTTITAANAGTAGQINGFSVEVKASDGTRKEAVSNILSNYEVGTEAKDARSDGSATFQIGANQGQSLNLSINDMRATTLGVYSLQVGTQSQASTAVKVIDQANQKVSTERSKLGASQNRLEHTIKNLDASAENLQASESRIRDVDMAKEMMEFTKHNILQQAATAMLAQANQAPQSVLQLLQ
jgi:flagellin